MRSSDRAVLSTGSVVKRLLTLMGVGKQIGSRDAYGGRAIDGILYSCQWAADRQGRR